MSRNLPHRFDELCRMPGSSAALLALLGEMVEAEAAFEAAISAAVNELNQTADRQQRHIAALEKRIQKLEGVHGA